MPTRRSPSLSLFAVLGALCSGSLRAQNVDISATALTQLRAWTWAYVGGSQTGTHPAGGLPYMGVVGQITFGSAALIGWNELSAPDSETFAVHARASGQGSLGSGGYDPFTMVVDVASPTPRAVEIDLERTGSGWGVIAQPTISVDIGNDGTVEYPNVPIGQVITVPGVTAGPSPLQVRISFSGVSYSGTSGDTTAELRVKVRPDNAVTFVQTASSCLPGQAGLEPPVQVFANDGIDLNFSPGLLVASAVAAPTTWGPSSPLPFATQCLLYPQPDVLLWEPSGHVHIPLPPALRPQVFHVQVVHFAPVGIVASDAYQITAN